MAITRFNPWALMPRWLEDIDWTPVGRSLRVYENDNDIVVEAVVAGVPAENVQVNIENGVITIKAGIAREEEAEDLQTSETRRYYYTTALSGGQWNKATAEVEDGVLKLTIPKAPEARPQSIKVETKSKKAVEVKSE